ncbi:MAG: DNA and RNA helicase [Clostridia bacterium]|nr:DNA and RNA helicase [Clostridia bacterium]
MFVNLYPNFGKGRILKKEMLENLRDYPRDFLNIYFKDYSNGIISGAQIIVGGSSFTVTPGVLKFKEQIYMLSDVAEVPYYPTNKEVVIKIKFFNEVSESDFKRYQSKVFIDDNTSLDEDELELGRFKLREGAVLRSEYTDFYDFSTEYNTINIINAAYSGPGQSTLNPLVLKYFSKVVFKSSTENVYDIGFAMQCSNQDLIHRELILYYISNRLGMEYKECSNIQIYKYLTLIVKEIESGIRRKMEVKQSGPSRIIVD